MEKDRKQESLKSIFNKFPEKFENLQSISMDFWQPYETVVRQQFPNTTIVYDKFHFSRLLNRHIETERREYQKELSDREKGIKMKRD